MHPPPPLPRQVDLLVVHLFDYPSPSEKAKSSSFEGDPMSDWHCDTDSSDSALGRDTAMADTSTDSDSVRTGSCVAARAMSKTPQPAFTSCVTMLEPP